jgi:hypothetical protein
LWLTPRERPGWTRWDAAGAGPPGRGQILAALAERDYLGLGQDGQITAAYPFSAKATPHAVRITGGAAAYSMCAIDALGVADMLSARVLISSADPSTGEQISVTVDGSDALWEPARARPRPQIIGGILSQPGQGAGNRQADFRPASALTSFARRVTFDPNLATVAAAWRTRPASPANTNFYI